MANPRLSRRSYGRTPGEIAFDRCLFPFVALLILNAAVATWSWAFPPPLKHAQINLELPPTLPPPPPPPLWHTWLPFALGIILAALWIRALTSLIRSWNDPAARVLRFASSVLLVPFGFAALRLLLLPILNP